MPLDTSVIDKTLYFAGDGEVYGLYHNSVLVKSFRIMAHVGDDLELLAQGRFHENKKRKSKLNKLPYEEWTKENRSKMRDNYRKGLLV